MILQQLLDLDKNLLIELSQIFPKQYALILKISAESILIWCGIFLVGMWLYGVYHKNIEYKETSLKVFFLLLTVFSIYTVVNLPIDAWREHPTDFLGNNSITPIINHPSNNSFPSGHAIFSTALVFGVFLYCKNIYLKIITLIIAILTVCARVLGGVHYVGDILGGIFFASIGVLIFKNISEKIYKKLSPYLIKIAGYIKL